MINPICFYQFGFRMWAVKKTSKLRSKWNPHGYWSRKVSMKITFTMNNKQLRKSRKFDETAAYKFMSGEFLTLIQCKLYVGSLRDILSYLICLIISCPRWAKMMRKFRLCFCYKKVKLEKLFYSLQFRKSRRHCFMWLCMRITSKRHSLDGKFNLEKNLLLFPLFFLFRGNKPCPRA